MHLLKYMSIFSVLLILRNSLVFFFLNNVRYKKRFFKNFMSSPNTIKRTIYEYKTIRVFILIDNIIK